MRLSKPRRLAVQHTEECHIKYDTQPDIARRILLDYFASNAKDISISDDRVGLEILYDDVADSEEFKLLKEMALDGKSYLEMAQARGISVATCRKRMQRAKEILRKKIAL